MHALLVATGGSVLRLEPAERSMRATLVSDAPARAIAVDAREGHVYAGGRDRILRSADAGKSWQEIPSAAKDIFSLAISPADGAVYVGTEPSAIFRSRDHGESWEELTALQEIPSRPQWRFPPRPWTHHVRAIAPSPHDPDRLLVGIELGGVMLSEDGGRSFSDHRSGAQKDCHAMMFHPTVEGRVYEAAGGGAAWSDDGGRTWQAADDGRDRHYCWALAVDPHDPKNWFTSAAPGPRQAHSDDGTTEAQLYRWHHDGPWQQVGDPLSGPVDSMPYAMTFAGEALYVLLRDGRLFASADHGDIWKELAIQGERPAPPLSMIAV
jgi:photosystem II stability/assembly factor-like uncharacterized protein